MCRLILAMGENIQPLQVLEAAKKMSLGETVNHSANKTQHPHGWGMVWEDDTQPSGLGIYRNPESIADTLQSAPLQSVQQSNTSFLAVHVREASLGKQQAIEYTHPITDTHDKSEHYLMHNGFLPGIHKALGRPTLDFDTQEYFDYLMAEKLQNQQELTNNIIAEKLRQVEPIGEWNSANAFLINKDTIRVINWTYPGDNHPDFFQMFKTEEDGITYIASEPQASLVSSQKWHPLATRSIDTYQIRHHKRTINAGLADYEH